MKMKTAHFIDASCKLIMSREKLNWKILNIKMSVNLNNKDRAEKKQKQQTLVNNQFYNDLNSDELIK